MKAVLIAICSAFVMPVVAALHAMEGITPAVYYGSEHTVTAGDNTAELAVKVSFHDISGIGHSGAVFRDASLLDFIAGSGK